MNVLIIIAVLVVGVIAHEIGHALMARHFGIKLEEFGLGFGPQLSVRKIGDTAVPIRLLPLGGYIKLDMAAFNKLAIWKKNLVFAAGPAVNFAMAFLTLWGFWVHKGIEIGTLWYTLPFKAIHASVDTLQMLGGATIQSIQSGGVQSMVGPVGIIGLTAQETTFQALYVLAITVALLFSLGFVNLLPIPGLDGGQILLTSVKVSKAGYIKVTNAGLYCLLTLGAVLAVWDSYRLFFGF